ncbi:hypothetical protein [Asanoa iriomotensis]|uniref:Uncharacterized protein n=1 Tax=Asanoa iriomotensis TaxID=234613 RepID=A0ABQ4C8A1_9ACTN|nr:hypothetical protein [Asanoa iriomotensis]GIF59003.1 hypothetical protein Air01nite_50980 [Asanoa iriomotensis]
MATAPSTVIPRWQRWDAAEERHPRRAGPRWLLRVALALPFGALALQAGYQGFAAPPATGLAALLPGGALLTCLTTGFVLAALGERLVAWQVPLRIMVPLVLVPALAYAGSQDLTAVLTVALLALAVEGFVHFAVAGRPEGAHRAGLALAAAALCDPVAILYAVAFAAAAPFVAAERRRSVPPSWAVLMFPTLAAAATWALLDWRLTGSVEIALDPRGPVSAAGGALVAVAHTPLYVAVAVVYAVRRPRALAGYLVPPAGVFGALLVGSGYSAVTAYLLLTVVALVAVPRSPSRRLGAFLGTVALAQWALTITWPPTSAAFQDWLRTAWGF